jgi:hypothetical protein
VSKQTKDWLGFWIRFAIGGLLGAGLGLVIWGRPGFRLYDSSLAGVFLIGGGAIIGGLAAALSRDAW